MSIGDARPVVVVSGSSGLIGTYICRRLSERYTVVGLDIQAPPDDEHSVHWIECDFTDANSIRDGLSEIRQQYSSNIASVLHLAAYYDFAGADSPLYQELTVDGTERLLTELHKFETVEQFVFSSSLLVMEPCEPPNKLTEDSPTRAEWAYPDSKLKAEAIIRDNLGSIPALILRLAGVYDEQGHSLPITQNIRRIAEKEFESYFFPGDAQRGQSFVHLEDLTDCFENAIDKRHELKEYEMLLVGEQECLSYEAMQDQIGRLLHGVNDWPTLWIPKPLAKMGAWAKDKLAASEERPFIKPWMVDLADAHYPVDNSRASEVLGWCPNHRLSETLPAMIESLKRDPKQWYEANKLPLPDEATLADLKASEHELGTSPARQ